MEETAGEIAEGRFIVQPPPLPKHFDSLYFVSEAETETDHDKNHLMVL